MADVIRHDNDETGRAAIALSSFIHIGEKGEPPEYAPEQIAGVLRLGDVAIVSGPPKSGKTWLLMELAVAVATGGSWLGFACRQGRVLYLDGEMKPASSQHRFATVARACGREYSDLAGSVDLLSLRGHTRDLAELLPTILDHTGTDYELFIVDPAYLFINGDENAVDDVREFCNTLDALSTQTGGSVVFAHHHSKGFKFLERFPDTAIDIVKLAPEEGEEELEDGLTVWRASFRLRDFPSREEVAPIPALDDLDAPRADMPDPARAHSDRVKISTHYESNDKWTIMLPRNYKTVFGWEPYKYDVEHEKGTAIMKVTLSPAGPLTPEFTPSLNLALKIREAIDLAATVMKNSTAARPCVTPYKLCQILGIEHPTLRQQENLVETLETGYSINVDIDMSKNPLAHSERDHIRGALIPCDILPAGEGKRSKWIVRFNGLPPTYRAAEDMRQVRHFPQELMRLGLKNATVMTRALWRIVRMRALGARSLHIRLMRDPKNPNRTIEIERAGVNVKTKVQRDRAERVLVEAVEEMVQEGYLTDYRVCTESGKAPREKEPHAYIELIP